MTQATDVPLHPMPAGDKSVSRGCKLVQETQIWQEDLLHGT